MTLVHGSNRALAMTLLALLVAGCAADRAYRQGRELASAEDFDRAVYHYSKALALEPDNIEYRKSLDLAKVRASQKHLELAKRYLEAGALDLAIVEFQVAATLDPTNRFVSDSLGNAIERRRELAAKAADTKSEVERMKEEEKAARGSGATPILRPSSEAPLSLNFPPNTKVKDIYTALGKAAGINVLFDTGIRDNETFAIDIANISFKKALDQVALANRHFYKVIDEKTIMVVPDNPQKRRDFEDHVIKTFYLSNANPNDVVNTLRGLLDARRIATNAALNAITIRDTPAKITVMERVIEANDKPPSEVVIDVEVLEVRKTHDLNWGTALSSYSVGHVLEQPDSINSTSGLRLSSIQFLNASDWLLTFPSASYRLEEGRGNIRSLARPSLRALDGKQVTLRLGDQVPIETSTFSAVAGGSVPLTRNFQFRDIGINIDITPRVHHNGEVTLQLQVELTSIGEDPDGPSNPIPPTFGNRRINTEIRLKDGETNLLAGLFTSSEESSRGGFPGIGSIPVLRTLLSSNSRRRRETDIVLTLTPHVVRTPNIGKRDLEPFYVGTESNIGGVGDVSMGATFGAGSPFTPPEGGDAGGEAGRPVAPPGLPPGAIAPPGQPGQPSPGFPGQPPGRIVPEPEPTPFNPEPNEPAPTAVVPRLGGALAAPAPDVSPTPAEPVAAPPAMVAIAPPTSTVAVDGELVVSVVIEGAQGVSHAPFYLMYDESILEVLDVADGGFLGSDGKPTQFVRNPLGGGRIVVGLSRLGRVPGVSGSGVLVTVRFRARAEGTTTLSFSQASLRDAESRPLPATWLPATVAVR